MVSRLVKCLVLDVAIVILAYLVVGDLQWRSAYAASQCTPSSGCRVSSYSYLPFVRVFTMANSGSPLPTLQSPLTLDWLQVLAALFVVTNVWYAYSAVRSRKSGRSHAADALTSSP